MEHFEELTDGVFAFERMAQPEAVVDLVMVAAADLLTPQVATTLEIIEDSLHGTRGDPDDVAEVTLAEIRIATEGHHHVRVVRQERPRRQVGFRFDQRHPLIIRIARHLLPGSISGARYSVDLPFIYLLKSVFYTDAPCPPPPTSHRDTSTTGRQTRRHDSRALLTAHDERVLAKAIEAGRDAAQRLADGSADAGDEQLIVDGENARHHFIEANVRLVQSIANKFNVPMHLDREDLVQDGMIGLDKAVDKFDWRRGFKFSTYATWWIRQSIQRGLEASATTIRIPGHRSRELRIAAAATTSRLTGELAMIDMLSQLDSMDRPLGDGTDTLGSMVRSNDEGPDETAERNVRSEQIDALLDHLDPTSRYAVAARFGLRGHEAVTFAVIANELGVTPQAVRRRVERAIEKLRTHAELIAA